MEKREALQALAGLRAGGFDPLAEGALETEVLARIPFEEPSRQGRRAGLFPPRSPAGSAYAELARRVARELGLEGEAVPLAAGRPAGKETEKEEEAGDGA